MPIEWRRIPRTSRLHPDHLDEAALVPAGDYSQCGEEPPALLLRGVEEFNQGRFFECHETIEEIWLREVGPVKNFYKGLIQIAAGLLHIGRGNYRGCVRLLETGSRYIEPYGPVCQRVDIAGLTAATGACRAVAIQLGRDRLHLFPSQIIPKISLAPPGSSGSDFGP